MAPRTYTHFVRHSAFWSPCDQGRVWLDEKREEIRSHEDLELTDRQWGDLLTEVHIFCLSRQLEISAVSSADLGSYLGKLLTLDTADSPLLSREQHELAKPFLAYVDLHIVKQQMEEFGASLIEQGGSEPLGAVQPGFTSWEAAGRDLAVVKKLAHPLLLRLTSANSEEGSFIAGDPKDGALQGEDDIMAWKNLMMTLLDKVESDWGMGPVGLSNASSHPHILVKLAKAINRLLCPKPELRHHANVTIETLNKLLAKARRAHQMPTSNDVL